MLDNVTSKLAVEIRRREIVSPGRKLPFWERLVFFLAKRSHCLV
jgi:hypothetical protein